MFNLNKNNFNLSKCCSLLYIPPLKGELFAHLSKSMGLKSDKLNFHQLVFLSFFHMSIVIDIVIVVIVTSSQIHCVSLTFVREVESRVIQNESDNNKRCYKSSLCTMSYKMEHPIKYHMSNKTEILSWWTVPEVEGGGVHNDVTGQRERLRCEQHPQRKIQRSE